MNTLANPSGSIARSTVLRAFVVFSLSGSFALGAVINGDLFVGNENSIVEGVPDQDAPKFVTIAEPTQVTGKVIVSNSEFQFTVPAVLTVNSQLTSNIGHIGFGFFGTGIALVSGPAASWTTTQELIVGQSAAGFLLVDAGADVFSNGGGVGPTFFGSGRAVVSDAGSRWINTGAFQVGSYDISGKAEFAVVKGGTFQTDQFVVANRGSVSITGTASTGVTTLDSRATGSVAEAEVGARGFWNTTSLTLGAAKLDLDGGATLFSTSATLGADGDSEVNVFRNSVWTNLGELQVGQEGEGLLTIRRGGRVSTNRLVIGEEGRVVLRRDATLIGEVVLSGGVLEALNFQGLLGPLALQAPSAIKFTGDDISLAFADSSAFVWGDNVLEVLDYMVDGTALRFGVNSDGLVAQQLELFNFGALGLGGTIDSQGYVTPRSLAAIPEPTTLGLLAALSALGAAASRRRRAAIIA